MRRVVPADIAARPFEAIRSRCARVAERARFVHIDESALSRYTAQLPLEEVRTPGVTSLPALDDPETLTAFVLQLDSVNFGSGYFPHLRKLPGKSGYRTVEARLLARFEEKGALSPEELAGFRAKDAADLFEQDLDAEPIAELMDLFARAFRSLGLLVATRFDGCFSNLVEAADRSAAQLLRILIEMPLYRDIARYEDFDVPFFKRAQIASADLALALPGGLGRFEDLDELTIFADNLVPHVLRMDGVLIYDRELLARIEREERLESGSSEETEIRACGVHAVERLASLSGLRAADLDHWLWTRGGGSHYKARPRHRARSVFY
ncbi:MAG: hypothetical protein GY725_26445 [bacterium]|nr:hypothetical protein [bacterium]